ncbi:MAG TPA: ROK family protein, partial [Clostridia bacterium]|nr:ROK family protein [Clostridia bacterium]
MQTFLGIEIGGTKLQLAIVEHGGRIRLKRKLAVQLEQGAAGIRARIEAELAKLPEAREVQA